MREGRRLGRVKLNYRFHNPNPPEALGRELLQICISANVKKVESAVKESVEKESALRVVAIDRNAQVVKLKDFTLFKMPKEEYEGKYYKISNDSIKEYAGEIVLELPSEMGIQLLDERQQKLTTLNLEEFVKSVAGKGAKDYEERYRRPSEIVFEQIKIKPINSQFAK